MDSTERKAVESNADSAILPIKRQQLTENTGEAALTIAEFKKRVTKAVDRVDHEELVKVLAMKVKEPKISTRSREEYHIESELIELYKSLICHYEYDDRHDEVVDCVRALLNDRRTSNIDDFMEELMLCYDYRDMDDIVRLVFDRSPQLGFNQERMKEWVLNAYRLKRYRVFVVLIKQPGFNINQPVARFGDNTSTRLIHRVVDYWETPSSHVLPAILAHPQILPDLRPWYHDRTALAMADHSYTAGMSFDGKQRAVRNVRLLLRHERVDIHPMKRCGPDSGYQGIGTMH